MIYIPLANKKYVYHCFVHASLTAMRRSVLRLHKNRLCRRICAYAACYRRNPGHVYMHFCREYFTPKIMAHELTHAALFCRGYGLRGVHRRKIRHEDLASDVGDSLEVLMRGYEARKRRKWEVTRAPSGRFHVREIKC